MSWYLTKEEAENHSPQSTASYTEHKRMANLLTPERLAEIRESYEAVMMLEDYADNPAVPKFSVIGDLLRHIDALEKQREGQPIETAPKDGTKILGLNEEGIEIVEWIKRQDIGQQEPGHSAGWCGIYAQPGRTREDGFPGEDHWIYEAQGQPTFWWPLPTPPTED